MAALPPFIARYEIKQRLGQGGMGAIYLARDPVIDRLVALKLLHNDIASDDIRKRFAQEARASGALTHPNIVTIHDYGEFEGLAVHRDGVHPRRDAGRDHPPRR